MIKPDELFAPGAQRVSRGLETFASMSCGSKLMLLAVQIAGKQHGAVSRKQLLEAGFSPSTIGRAVAGPRLFPVFKGVYLVGRPQLSYDGLRMASLLAAGDGAVLGGRSAADVWGFLDHKNPIEVFRKDSGRTERGLIRVNGERWRPSLKIRRRKDIVERGIRVKRGLSMTSPEWTLLELASELPATRYRWAFSEADRLGLLDDRVLGGLAGRTQGLKGGAMFRGMVERRIPNIGEARSLLEALVLDLSRRGLIPAPEINRKTHQYKPDFRWPEHGVLVEADGYEFHRGREAFENDTLRANRLRAEGWTVLRFTWRMITERPEEVASMIRQALSERGSRRK